MIAPKHSIVKQVHEHYLPGLYDHKITGGKVTARDVDVNARNIYFNQVIVSFDLISGRDI